jgi:hypothetical protein
MRDNIYRFAVIRQEYMSDMTPALDMKSYNGLQSPRAYNINKDHSVNLCGLSGENIAQILGGC